MAARTTIQPRSLSGIAWSMISRTTNGGTRASSAAAKIAIRKTMIVPRYGRANAHTRLAVPSAMRTSLMASESPGIMWWGDIRMRPR